MRSTTSAHSEIPRAATNLTVVVLVLVPVATAVGLFVPGFYRDATAMIPQARGQDLATLLIAEPLLFGTLVAARRGRIAAPAIWIGVLGYVLYTYAMYSYTAYFNALFLVYVAVLSASLFALIDLLVHLNTAKFRACVRATLPPRPVAIFLALVGLLFLFVWLGQIVPATLHGVVPDAVAQAKTPTNAVYVQDLGIVIPLLFLAARWLWQRSARGYVLSLSLLVMADLMLVALVSMALFMAQAHVSNALTMAGLFAVLAFASLGFTALFLANLGQPTTPQNVGSPRVSIFTDSGSLLTESDGTVEHARETAGMAAR